jgi:hypothetical protein
MYKSPPWRVLCVHHTSIICVHTSILTCAYTYVSHRKAKEVKSPRGKFQGPCCGGGKHVQCIKELNRPARAAQVHKGT